MGLKEWWNDVAGGAEYIYDLAVGNESIDDAKLGFAVVTGQISEQDAVAAAGLMAKGETLDEVQQARDEKNNIIAKYGKPAEEFFEFIDRNPHAVTALGKLGGDAMGDGKTTDKLRKMAEFAEQHGGAKAFEDIMAVVAQKDAAGTYQMRPGFGRFVHLVSSQPALAGGLTAGGDGGLDLGALRNLTADPDFYTDAAGVVERLSASPGAMQLISGVSGAEGAAPADLMAGLTRLVENDRDTLKKLNAIMDAPGFNDLMTEIAGNEKLAGMLKGIGGLDPSGDTNMAGSVINKLYELSQTRKNFFADAAQMLRDNKDMVSRMSGTVSEAMEQDPVAGLNKLTGMVDGNNMINNIFNTLSGFLGKDFAEGLKQFVMPFLEMLAPLIGKLTGFGPALDSGGLHMTGTGDMTRDATTATGRDPEETTVRTETGTKPVSSPAPETAAIQPERQKVPAAAAPS